MANSFRDIIEGFVAGGTAADSLHAAAQRERDDVALAERVLMTFTEYENSSWDEAELRNRMTRLLS
jgi:hypothetical protein